jgi:hypothetical protein
MATWVEDIVQALENLGGQAPLSQIYAEVKRIRKEPLPTTYTASIRERIESHSSDSKNFKGKDIFRKVDKGVWALRDSKQLPGVNSTFHKKSSQTNIQTYSPPESSIDILNILNTIKQYREFHNPDNSEWKEYVKEFFHILGFATCELSPRLFSLQEISSQNSPAGLIIYVSPDENFDEVVPGLSWKSYAMFAAHYYQVEWGIITNGLQLKIINYKNSENNQPLYWPDMDNVIINEQQDTFFSIYKIFSYIKHSSSYSSISTSAVQNSLEDDGGLKERHILRRKFWSELLEKARTKTNTHQNISPSISSWISASAGKSGLRFNYFVRKHDAQVEFYINSKDTGLNKKRFQYFLRHKSEIERTFGESLDWQLLPDKRASRIRYIISGYGLRDEAHWDELQDQLINAMIRLSHAFSPYIDQLEK